MPGRADASGGLRRKLSQLPGPIVAGKEEATSTSARRRERLFWDVPEALTRANYSTSETSTQVHCGIFPDVSRSKGDLV